MPCVLFEKSADGVFGKIKIARDFGKSAGFIIGLDIFQNFIYQSMLIVITAFRNLGKCGEIHEYQPHGDTYNSVGMGLFFYKSPKHIFDKVLDGKDIFCLKV